MSQYHFNHIMPPRDAYIVGNAVLPWPMSPEPHAILALQEIERLRSDLAAMREALVQLHDAALCIVTDGSARDSEAWFNKCRIAASEALAKGGQP